MVAIEIELDDEVAESLAARIDDAMPTLSDVVRHVLERAAARFDLEVGILPLCACGMLDRLAEDPIFPFTFDEQTNEYHVVGETPRGRGEWVIRHCPACGGRAPESKRQRLFAIVELGERHRLSALCEGIETFADAIARFGAPDFDYPHGLELMNESASGAETFEPRRVIGFGSLSETANVRFTQRAGDLAVVSFEAKYVGPAVERGL